MLRPIALALAVIAAPAASQEAPRVEPGRLTAVGTGEASGPPNRAVLTIGVVTQAATAREALQRQNRTMAETIDALRQAGVESRDLQTSNFRIAPHYEAERGRPARIVGAQASNTLSVRVRDLARVGEVLDRAVTLGANQISGPSFESADADRLRDEARTRAVEDARRRARLIAEPLGVRLGRILSVEETTLERPQPMPMARASMADGAVPVEAGESTFQSNVSVVWEILQ